MHHGKQNRTLSRTRRGRAALLRNLAIEVLVHGRVLTTEAKAKEVRPFLEKLVTRAKDDTVANRRIVASRLGEPKSPVVQRLFTEVAPRYATREGGYTRIIKAGQTPAGRRDAFIELVE